MHTYFGHKAPVLTLRISKCCNFLLSSSKDFMLHVWDLSNDSLVKSEIIPKSGESANSESDKSEFESATPIYFSAKNEDSSS